MQVSEHYFEMSRYDAERALGIYKTFTKQTNMVVEFLSTARQYENATRLEIPKLKHAPTSLTSSLEEYLNDPDFEVNRRQYLAQQDAKKGKKTTSNGASEPKKTFTKAPVNKGGSNGEFLEPKVFQSAPPKPDPKGPALDLIDFFDSIEQNQQPMASAPPQQSQVPNFGVGPHYQQQMQLQQTGVLPQEQSNFFPQVINSRNRITAAILGAATLLVSHKRNKMCSRTLLALDSEVILSSHPQYSRMLSLGWPSTLGLSYRSSRTSFRTCPLTADLNSRNNRILFLVCLKTMVSHINSHSRHSILVSNQ
jgi:hypothetical protein